MKMIIEARLVDDLGETAPVQLAMVDRPETTSTLGLSLAEGRSLLASAQQYLVRSQCLGIADAHSYCPQCDARRAVKGWHDRQIRTVFGRVTVRSPRVRCCCHCAGKRPGASASPLNMLVPVGHTPELGYLQVKWAAYLPYAAATKLLKEVLPIGDAISINGIKRRVRVVGAALERAANQPQHLNNVERSSQAGSSPPVAASTTEPLSSLAVDSAWLKHCDPPRTQGRHVNLVAGQACFDRGRTRLYAYVHNQVPGAAVRLDDFLSTSGVAQDERVTIVTDGAGEFEKAVDGSSRPICRILDWFHIAMKLRTIEQSALKHPDLLAPGGRPVRQEVESAKWLVRHGKAGKAIARLKGIHDAFDLVPEPHETALYWHLRQTFWYLRSNERFLVNYARRHHKGLPISSATAESAVNQVVSARMAKQRQKRWSDEGAHLLAQVRVQVPNGELVPRPVPTPLRPTKPQPDPEYDAYLLKMAA